MAYEEEPVKSTGVAHVWGVTGGVGGITVTSSSVSRKFGIEEQIEDEGGRVIHKRYDDPITTISLDGIMLADSSDQPDIGDTLSYDGVNYVVTSVDYRGEQKGFKKYSLSGENHENSPPATEGG